MPESGTPLLPPPPTQGGHLPHLTSPSSVRWNGAHIQVGPPWDARIHTNPAAWQQVHFPRGEVVVVGPWRAPGVPGSRRRAWCKVHSGPSQGSGRGGRARSRKREAVALWPHPRGVRPGAPPSPGGEGSRAACRAPAHSRARPSAEGGGSRGICGSGARAPRPAPEAQEAEPSAPPAAERRRASAGHGGAGSPADCGAGARPSARIDQPRRRRKPSHLPRRRP